MKFINITDFTGGIQESVTPEGFSNGQWSRLTGFIPENGEMRSQWHITQVGNPVDIVRIWPLTSISGTWIVGIFNDGTIRYGKPSGSNITWITLSTVSNPDNTGTLRAVQASNTYRFVCSVPVQPHKYAVTVDNSDPDNPTKDTPASNTLTSVAGSSTTTGVLISNSGDTRTTSYSHYNMYVAYVDDAGDQVRIIGFPNQRRLPLHDTNTGDKLKRFDGSSFTNLIRSNPAVDSYPYTYLDIDGQLRPGTGVIPTATVGVMKNNLLLLGDIYWRSDVANKESDLSDAYLQTTTSTDEIDDQEHQFIWPAGYPTTARVIFNEGPGVLYLKNNTNIRADIIGFSVGTTTITFETLEEHGYANGDTVEVTGMRENINGVYTASSVTTNTFTVSRTLPGRQITHRASSGTTRTITTQSKHNLVVGQWVGISGLTSDYNGGYQVSSIPTPNSFKYEASPSLTESSTADAGIVDTPYVQVRSLKSEDGFVTVELGDRLQTNPTVRYVHNLYPGDRIHLKDLNGYASIHGVPAALNGVHEVVDTPTSSSFRIRNPYQTAMRITQRDFVAGATPTTDPAEITFTTDGEHEFEVGTEVVISGLGSEEFNGRFTIESIPAGDEFEILVMTERTYSSTKTINRPNAIVVGDRMLAASGAASPPYTIPGGLCSISLGRSVSYTPSSPEGKVVPGEYRAIPDSNWTNIYASASLPQTKVKAVRTLNTVYQTLNHTNTGRHRGSMYFATGGEIDTFDPRAVLQIAKGGATITGMHVIDDSVIITTSRGNGGGLYRITGYLSRLINYGKANDPNAIRIELLRAGLYTPNFTYGTGTGSQERDIHTNQSVYWQAAGIVVFVTEEREVWYTNGVTTGRLDTFGVNNKLSYSYQGSKDLQLAVVGDRLFFYKLEGYDPRLYCLSLINGDGSTGNAIWTEIALPNAAYDTNYNTYDPDDDSLISEYAYPSIDKIFSMVGSNDTLLFICDHGVDNSDKRYIIYAMNTSNPSMRGSLRSTSFTRPVLSDLPAGYTSTETIWPLWLTVVTPPISGEDNTRLYNWNKFAFNFTGRPNTLEPLCWLHTVIALNSVYTQTRDPFFSSHTERDVIPNNDLPFPTSIFNQVEDYVGARDALGDYDWGTFANSKITIGAGLRQNPYWGNQLHQFLAPAYIGPQAVVSFIVTLTGDITLHSANVWYAGSRPNNITVRTQNGLIGEGAQIDTDIWTGGYDADGIWTDTGPITGAAGTPEADTTVYGYEYPRSYIDGTQPTDSAQDDDEDPETPLQP